MNDCTTCEGSGLYSKKTWEAPAEFCEDCNGTGDADIQECVRLILEVDRVMGKPNPALAEDVIAALEQAIKERS